MTSRAHTAEHLRWLAAEESRLLRFGRKSADPDGYSPYLDDDGNPDRSKPRFTWIAGRMAYVHYLGHLRGHAGAGAIADRLLEGLDTIGRDRTYGGWRETDQAPDGEEKTAYTHSFVLLAGAVGKLADNPRADRVIADALDVLSDTFSEPGTPMYADASSGDRKQLTAYRGVNANMHMVETLMTTWLATGDEALRRRADAISRFVVASAAKNGWRIPEHYDPTWTPQLEYNFNRPSDQFRPYGATVGHAFEWCRMLTQVATASDAPDVLRKGAAQLYDRAVQDGFQDGEHPGFVYTTDWSGEPIVTDHLNWVVAEAITAADSLYKVTGDERYRADYQRWWSIARHYFIDLERGSWTMQLSEKNEPQSTIWTGKPDLYHVYHAATIPALQLSSSVAASIIHDSDL